MAEEEIEEQAIEWHDLRKCSDAKEIEVTENLKRKYTPRVSQLFKQFTI